MVPNARLAVAQALALAGLITVCRLVANAAASTPTSARRWRSAPCAPGRRPCAAGCNELHRPAADDPHQLLGAERVLIAVGSRRPGSTRARPSTSRRHLGDDQRQRRHRALAHRRRRGNGDRRQARCAPGRRRCCWRAHWPAPATSGRRCRPRCRTSGHPDRRARRDGEIGVGHRHGQPSPCAFDGSDDAVIGPQRQILPSMVMMSVRLGLGFFASSSAAFMIWPDWQ